VRKSQFLTPLLAIIFSAGECPKPSEMIVARLISGWFEGLALSELSHRARRAGAWVWMCAAFVAALGLAVVVLSVAGTGEKGTGIALHLTGRLSFLLFWPAYAGAAVATFFGPRFRILVRHSRDFGLAYASAHLVHVGLVAHLVSMSERPFLEAIMPFFAVGVVWTYVLALLSWERLSRLLSRSFWRAVHNIGLEYLALVFFSDLVLLPIQGHAKRPLEYLPFSILAIAGPLLRSAAPIRRSRPGRFALRFQLGHLRVSSSPADNEPVNGDQLSVAWCRDEPVRTTKP
jgi:hypothetical protein